MVFPIKLQRALDILNEKGEKEFFSTIAYIPHPKMELAKTSLPKKAPGMLPSLIHLTCFPANASRNVL